MSEVDWQRESERLEVLLKTHRDNFLTEEDRTFVEDKAARAKRLAKRISRRTNHNGLSTSGWKLSGMNLPRIYGSMDWSWHLLEQQGIAERMPAQREAVEPDPDPKLYETHLAKIILHADHNRGRDELEYKKIKECMQIARSEKCDAGEDNLGKFPSVKGDGSTKTDK